MSRILVAGIGNIFLGDDGFGPAVVRRLAEGASGPAPGVTMVDYGIRGLHLAYDLLAGYDGLILIDTVAGRDEAGSVTVTELDEHSAGRCELGSAGDAAPDLDAHGMDPAAVLASLNTLGGKLPRTLLVGCVPADLDDGIGLSPPVRAAIEPAARAVLRLLSDEFAVLDAAPDPHLDAITAAGE
ncbi:MAG TPA: hydrogenase maturation protease [Jatrophihabitantaceae bacterium]|jgi:hydrogenase maturation protease|nr:hydrogenase maturation protease [Jatrophihabitantaceae bacterium]